MQEVGELTSSQSRRTGWDWGPHEPGFLLRGRLPLELTRWFDRSDIASTGMYLSASPAVGAQFARHQWTWFSSKGRERRAVCTSVNTREFLPAETADYGTCK